MYCLSYTTGNTKILRFSVVSGREVKASCVCGWCRKRSPAKEHVERAKIENVQEIGDCTILTINLRQESLQNPPAACRCFDWRQRKVLTLTHCKGAVRNRDKTHANCETKTITVVLRIKMKQSTKKKKERKCVGSLQAKPTWLDRKKVLPGVDYIKRWQLQKTSDTRFLPQNHRSLNRIIDRFEKGNGEVYRKWGVESRKSRKVPQKREMYRKEKN